MFIIGKTIRKGQAIPRAAALAAVVVVTPLLLPTMAQAEVGWQYANLDADECWDAAWRDSDMNGLIDDVWFDIDSDCSFDTHLWNSVGFDDLLETLTFDMDEDGNWEAWLADNNQLPGFDEIYWDYNADGFWDQWAYYVQPEFEMGIIGGSPDRSGSPLGVVELIAAQTHQGVFNSDTDGDGFNDNVDSYPHDRDRR